MDAEVHTGQTAQNRQRKDHPARSSEKQSRYRGENEQVAGLNRGHRKRMGAGDAIQDTQDMAGAGPGEQGFQNLVGKKIVDQSCQDDNQDKPEALFFS